jgi:hypothetical protein
MTLSKNVQKLATDRLANSLGTIVKLALTAYEKQFSVHTEASRDRYVRTVVLVTYQGFYQEAKMELANAQSSVKKTFIVRALRIKRQFA